MPIITPYEIGEIVPQLPGPAAQRLVRRAMSWLSIDELNDRYDDLSWLQGPDFAKSFLDDVGIDYSIGNSERLLNLPSGPFITISNHPYGHIDGMMLIDLFGHLRQDYKVMVNSLLARIRMLEPNFITVVPTGRERTAPRAESISGVREAMTLLRDGGVLGLFPSGAVSDLSLRERCVRDRQWQDAAVRLIRKAGVPVVPVRFFDRSSDFYYSLGLISSGVRLLRLPSEILNKDGKTIRLGIGETILPNRLLECTSTEELRQMLRHSVYGMPMPESFIRRSRLSL